MDHHTLVYLVAEKTSYTRREVRKIISAIVNVLYDEIAGGGSLEIPGIGTITTAKVGPWLGRNVLTNKRVFVPAKRRIKLHPCPSLRDKALRAVKIMAEVDLEQKYGLKEEQDGKVRSADRPGEGGERKARKRFAWL